MKTIVEILVDNSNSMGPCEGWPDREQYLLPDNSTRMSLARRILVDDILPIIEDSSIVNVRTFHSTNDLKEPVDLKLNDLYTSHFDKENLSDVISKIPDPVKTGGTPITSALKKVIDNLQKYSDWDRKIMLVTDGQETEKSDYRESALQAMQLHGIPCSVFIIGISQSVEAEKLSKQLTIDTGGGYVNLKTTKLDSSSISSKLSNLKSKVLNDQVNTIINNSNPVSYPVTNRTDTKVIDKEETRTNNIPENIINSEEKTSGPPRKYHYIC